MNLHFENVNLNSNSGPNSFANKLYNHLPNIGVSVDRQKKADAYLCFIESGKVSFSRPMFQRLDGIYFNTDSDYNSQNKNIKRTYDMADGVIFQSEFNKNLISRYFGEHKNHIIIHNGADLSTIEKSPVLEFDKYENLWCCAASWRPHKRLSDNIRYFLEHSRKNDGLMIAGSVNSVDIYRHDRIHYLGNLKQSQLYSLYKKSKYFLHLAWLDHCPNVVADARASGCQIICSSTGGTKEIAGSNAIIIQEEKWDFKPVKLYSPPRMDFSKKTYVEGNSELDMLEVAKKYKDFIENDLVRF